MEKRICKNSQKNTEKRKKNYEGVMGRRKQNYQTLKYTTMPASSHLIFKLDRAFNYDSKPRGNKRED